MHMIILLRCYFYSAKDDILGWFAEIRHLGVLDF